MNGEAKITNLHRDRLAVIYLRQSSMAQVREHTESTTRQYGLAEEAVRLGWARPDVLVIDTDLGVSGRWGVARKGFTELVRRVCCGEVGAIFGIEISRLARSNAEVARLMEFAAITETLLIDADGVYDPGDVNDRMLLGMKSTIGEVELHVMAQRLQASKRAAAERGELRTPLPVGYVHDETGEIVIDPDAEVQAAIRDLFAAFTACGSAYGVVAAFADRRFPLRAYGGAWAGQLRWGALTHARVLGVLRNPCYAGAYVHGRYSSRRRVDPDGTVHTGLVERSRAEWPVLIHDHHDGYIGWADYLANEAALAANRTNAGARPPREGSALCQGIMICGSCGKPMRTNYHTDQRPGYECSGRADRLTTPTCRSIAASTVDEAVTELLLNALNPNEIALALAAADEVADRHRRIGRAAELAVERARYEADRAERAFHAVEPDNRLVARSLDRKPVGGQTRRPRPSRAGARGGAGHTAAAARAGGARETRRRPARALACGHHQQQGPQTAAAHRDRRHHPAPRTRPRQGPDRDPLAHRGIRRSPGGSRRSPWDSRAQPLARGRHGDPPRSDHGHRRDGGHAQRRRDDHRTRPPVRRQSRPMDPARLPYPRSEPLRRRRDQRRRRRRTARREHRRRLRLDQDRQARRPPRNREPALHPLDRPRRGRMPMPHHRIRPSQPIGPTHRIPHSGLNAHDVGPGWHHIRQPTSTSPTRIRCLHATAGRDNMKHPSRRCGTGWPRRRPRSCWNRSSRRISCRARMGFGRSGRRHKRWSDCVPGSSRGSLMWWSLISPISSARSTTTGYSSR